MSSSDGRGFSRSRTRSTTVSPAELSSSNNYAASEDKSDKPRAVHEPGRGNRAHNIAAMPLPSGNDAAHTAEVTEAVNRLAIYDSIVFAVMIFVAEILFIGLYARWFRYPNVDDSAEQLAIYPLVVDVSVMVFFGFGYLMSFLRRYGYSAIGYTMLLGTFAVQWSIIWEEFFDNVREGAGLAERQRIGVHNILNGLFAAATVMVSVGAIIGKASPVQLLIMTIVEVPLYWINVFVCINLLEALDVGGGMLIHMFGAYFGMAVCFVFTSRSTRGHSDNSPCYISDLFSLAGTVLLWVYWPSFNAAAAPDEAAELRAIVNTFLSLCSATCWTFFWSRVLNRGKIQAVHLQNSILAGGVVMGVAADQRMYPATALAVGAMGAFASVAGYEYLTPVLNRYGHIQDICGVHNVHGLPGVIGAILAVVVTATTEHDQPRGKNQPAFQVAAIFITLGLAVFGGLLTAGLMKAVHMVSRVKTWALFQDRGFWDIPSYIVVAVEAHEPLTAPRDKSEGDGE